MWCRMVCLVFCHVLRGPVALQLVLGTQVGSELVEEELDLAARTDWSRGTCFVEVPLAVLTLKMWCLALYSNMSWKHFSSSCSGCSSVAHHSRRQILPL